jgi:selenide,water dikinase
MKDMPEFKHPDLLVGSSTYDDAGVYRLSADIALIQTLDFFTPMVDDPYLFGQIAAANSLSDVYAMGGIPLTAMNIAAFPLCGMEQVFAEVLRGGAMKIREAGALLVGGHTVTDDEPKYGLSVTGIVHPDRITANSAGEEGDLLFLTKKLGIGIINTALKAERVAEDDVREALESMAELNAAAASAMAEAGVRCATDITGFGFLGHLNEVVSASGLGAEIWATEIPYWSLAARLAEEAVIPGGAYRNLEFLEDKVEFYPQVPLWQKMVFYDPQTSGGLLMAIKPEKAAALEGELESREIAYAIVGRLKKRRGIKILKD